MRQQTSWYALGSDIIVTAVHDHMASYGPKIFTKLQQHVAAFEQRFSRFLPQSELTKVNQRAGQTVTVSPEFRQLLMAARQASTATDGLYNPFVLPALQRAGYVGSWPTPDNPRAGTDFSARSRASVQAIHIEGNRVRLPANTAIDFGGIGKGYVLDQLAALLDAERLNGYWLSAGGDIICAGTDEDEQPWQIGVQHATQPEQVIQTITNPTGVYLAIATSGVTKRRGMRGNKPWHHLIDPRTGQPAVTDILTVTVTATRALTADVYAKCTVIAGAEWAAQAQHRGAIQTFLIQKEREDL